MRNLDKYKLLINRNYCNARPVYEHIKTSFVITIFRRKCNNNVCVYRLEIGELFSNVIIYGNEDWLYKSSNNTTVSCVVKHLTEKFGRW